MKAIFAVFEFLSILMLHNVLLKKHIFNNFKYYMIISVFASIIINPIIMLPNYNGGIMVLLILFFLTLVVSKNYDREKINIFCELCISQVLVMVLQFITYIIIHLMLGKVQFDSGILIVNMITIMILIYTLGKGIKNIDLNVQWIVSRYPQINVLIINAIIFNFLIKLFVTHFELRIDVLINICLLLGMLLVINIFCIFLIVKRNREDKKDEIKESINPLIDELMNKMKASEHEYKNHLNILYSMIQVCNVDELRNRAKVYVGEVMSSDDLLSNLSQIDNTIIKAILFSKIQQAKKQNVEFTYLIESDLEYIALDDSELTVLLANLLNNAIEASNLSDNKGIDLDIYEEEENYIIHIRNSTQKISKDVVKKMFREGYSTKGNNRGYGLFNIKSILDKHKGKLNFEVEDGFIEFNIEIPMLK